MCLGKRMNIKMFSTKYLVTKRMDNVDFFSVVNIEWPKFMMIVEKKLRTIRDQV